MKGKKLFECLQRLCAKYKKQKENEINVSEVFKKHITFFENLDFGNGEAFSEQNLTCSRNFSKGEILFKCFDCIHDNPLACYCKNCFIFEKHKGHRVEYEVSLSNEGCCDCGDAYILKKESFCDNHRGLNFADCSKIFQRVPSEFELFLKVLSEFVFYSGWTLIENTELDQKTLNNNDGQEPASIIFRAFFDYLQELIQKHSWFGLYFTEKVLSQKLVHFNEFHHDCANKNKFVYYKAKRACTCTAFELLFRFGFYYGDHLNRSIHQFSLNLFPNENFRRLFIRAFFQHIGLVFHCQEISFEGGFLPPRLIINFPSFYFILHEYNVEGLEHFWENKNYERLFGILKCSWKYLFRKESQNAAQKIVKEIIGTLGEVRKDKDSFMNHLNSETDVILNFFQNIIFEENIATIKLDKETIEIIRFAQEHINLEFSEWVSCLKKVKYETTLDLMILTTLEHIEKKQFNAQPDFSLHFQSLSVKLSLLISYYVRENIPEESIKLEDIIKKSLAPSETNEKFWDKLFAALNFQYEKIHFSGKSKTDENELISSARCFKNYRFIYLAFLFLYQYAASRLVGNGRDLLAPIGKLDAGPELINLFLNKVVLLSEDYIPILSISNLGPELIKNKLFTESLETLIRTLHLTFDQKPFDRFQDCLKEFGINDNLPEYKTMVSKCLAIDPKTKLIHNKVSEICYDPGVLYSSSSKVKTFLFEVISKIKMPDVDPVIGSRHAGSEWEFLKRNLRQITNSKSTCHFVNSLFAYFGEIRDFLSLDYENLFLFLRILDSFSIEIENYSGFLELVVNEPNESLLEAWASNDRFQDFKATLLKLIRKFRKKIQRPETLSKIDEVTESNDTKKRLMKNKQYEIMKQFQQKQEIVSKLFSKQLAAEDLEDKMDSKDKEDYACLLCQSSKASAENPLCFISIFQQDNLSRFYKNEKEFINTSASEKAKYKLALTGCFHTIHRDCCSAKKEYFFCPVCRTYSNFLFPIISSSFKKIQVTKNRTDFSHSDNGPLAHDLAKFDKDVVKLVGETCELLRIKFFDVPVASNADYFIDLLIFHSELLLKKELQQTQRNLRVLRELFLFGRIQIKSGLEEKEYAETLRKDFAGFIDCKKEKEFKNELFYFLKLFWQLSIFSEHENCQKAVLAATAKILNSLLVLKGTYFLFQGYSKETSFTYSTLTNSLLSDDAFKYLVFGSLNAYLNIVFGLLSTVFDIETKAFFAANDEFEKFALLQENFGNVFSLKNILEFDKSLKGEMPLDSDWAELSVNFGKLNPKSLFQGVEVGKNYHEFVTAHFFKTCTFCQSFPPKHSKALFLCLICGLCFCGVKCKKNPQNLSSIKLHILTDHCTSSAVVSIKDGRVVYISKTSEGFSTDFTFFKKKRGYLFLNSYGKAKAYLDVDFASFALDKCAQDAIESDLYERKILEEIFKQV